MPRPRKNEETETPWVVRDVPAHVRRKVRVYAAEHDMTMAQAVEAMVEGRYGSQADQELIEGLMRVYGRIIVEDMPGAQVEAKQVTGLLEQRRIEGRLDPLFQLPAPPPAQPEMTPLQMDAGQKVAAAKETISQFMDMSPDQIVIAYFTALHVSERYDIAADLLSRWSRVRSFSSLPLPQVAEILRLYHKQHAGRIYNFEIWPAVFPDPNRTDRCEVKVRYSQIPAGATTEEGAAPVLIERTFSLTKDHRPPTPKGYGTLGADEKFKPEGYLHWAICDSEVDEFYEARM